MKTKKNPLASENTQLRKRNQQLEDLVSKLEDEKRELEILNKNYRRVMYRLGSEVRNHQFDILRIFVETIEARDHYTRGHSERVTKYAIIIARAIGLSENEINLLHQAGHLHDIGKIYWDKADFTKKAEKKEDMVVFREHPVAGAEYLKRLGRDDALCNIVRYHHEHYGGVSIITHPGRRFVGYPGELSGEEIPLLSRILTIADAFDAMITERPYRPKMSVEKAIEELKRCCGMPYNKRTVSNKESEIQFDPKIVKALLSVETIGSSKARTAHKLGCPYILRINSLDMVINPSGYVPCRLCIRKAA